MNRSVKTRSSIDLALSGFRAWLNALRQRPTALIGFVLAAITLAVYCPVISFDFVEFDDDRYVAANPVVQQGLSFGGVLWAFGGFHVSNWHPMTWLSHMLDCSVFGLSAGWHHFTNVLFHTVNVVLLFLLLRRLTGATWRSAFVAALFAWHPLHVESVAWISERKDLLSTFFLILGIWAYVRYTEKPSGRRYVLLLILFALGLMSKPMLVTFPCLLLLIDYWPLERIGPAGQTLKIHPGQVSAGKRLNVLLLITEKLPLFVMSAVTSLLTVLAQRSGDAIISLHSMPFSGRIANAVASYSGYLSKMFWPVDLCAYYPMEPISAGLLICSALVLAGLTWLVWRGRYARPYLAFGWLWYLVTLLPVIGLLQVGAQAMADRYTYVPLLGIFILIVWSAAPFIEAWSTAFSRKLAIAGGILVMCLVGTGFQLQHWRNGVRLFVRCIEIAPNCSLAHHNLGFALSVRGQSEEAVAQFEESLRGDPNDPLGHYCLAQNVANLGQTSEAITHYSEALRLKPRYPSAHLKLGVLLAQEGRAADAIPHFISALKDGSANASAHVNLAIALDEQGQTDYALRHYRTAVEMEPLWPEALARLARFLATHQDPRVRDGTTAVRLAEAANQLTAHSQAALLNDLAAAYAESGRFEDAVATERRAMRLVSNSSHKELAQQIQNCLELYEERKPYHRGQ